MMMKNLMVMVLGLQHVKVLSSVTCVVIPIPGKVYVQQREENDLWRCIVPEKGPPS
jgi:hypothetical protein